MKLLNLVTIRITPLILIVMSIWAVMFYFAIINEVNDETDDSLEDFSEMIISRKLRGLHIAEESNGSNNLYFIREVDAVYAQKNYGKRFSDSLVYIKEKDETEPARILKTYFKDSDNKTWELLVAIPSIEKDDLIRAIIGWLTFLWISLLIIIIVMNLFVLHKRMRHLHKQLDWMKNYRIDGKNRPLIKDTKVDE